MAVLLTNPAAGCCALLKVCREHRFVITQATFDAFQLVSQLPSRRALCPFDSACSEKLTRSPFGILQDYFAPNLQATVMDNLNFAAVSSFLW